MDKKIIINILIVIVLLACNPDLDYNVRGYTQKIIVEGTVETGKYPVVYLSLNVPLWKNVDSTSILDHVIRYAKVTVSDGTKTEILTSMWDKTHFPPYLYRATEIIGEEGKSYQLKVEYSGITLYSNTTIPQGSDIVSIQTSASNISDTLKILSVNIAVDKTKKSGFRFFTKKRLDKRYIETPILFNDELKLNGLHNFKLSPQPTSSDSSYHEGQYFTQGDTIDIKVVAIDSVSVLFFKDLSMFSTAAGNIFLNEVKPLKSNITEPGFGIWYGSAVRNYRYVVK